ncbi:hypothetical protein [Aestuariibacter sp. A3R04]|uniref:hypothetical protein n=1 Tax=Aestuariibacter sp. A3R04 TaxID=2841571 RepID=UPI001C09233E|nr:hypothetical protein [Aestuariibacter sp. A3R04]MBU3020959.1 hypothetical protein [Aestuariibacter sp. A3R04]
MSFRDILTVLLLAPTLIAHAANREYTLTTSFAGENYGIYHIAVLNAAMDITEEDFGEATIKHHPLPMSQGRQIMTLRHKEADIMWSVTTDQLEADLLPVRFPLIQGLGGYRVFVIHKDRQPDFMPNQTLDNIKLMYAVQGGDWPDTRILKSHDFRVSSANWSDWYSTMYRGLEEGIVDYFPRNVVEVYRDLNHHKRPNLVMEQNHLLVYPSYEYFFVGPHLPELRQRLKVGLTRLLETGELARLFNQYPNHQKAKAMIADPRRQKHYLTSPLLSYELEGTNWSSHPEIMVNALNAITD